MKECGTRHIKRACYRCIDIPCDWIGKIGLVQMIRPGAPAVLSHITMHTGMGHFYFFLQARKTRFIKELTTLADDPPRRHVDTVWLTEQRRFSLHVN